MCGVKFIGLAFSFLTVPFLGLLDLVLFVAFAVMFLVLFLAFADLVLFEAFVELLPYARAAPDSCDPGSQSPALSTPLQTDIFDGLSSKPSV